MKHHVSTVAAVLALVALTGLNIQCAEANSAFNVGFLGGLDTSGQGKQTGFLSSTLGNSLDLAGGIPNLLNGAVQQLTRPLDGVVGSLLQPMVGTMSGLTGSLTGQFGGGLSLGSSDSPAASAAANLASSHGVASGLPNALNQFSLPTGLVGGLTTGLAAASGLNSVTSTATQASQTLINPGKLIGGGVGTAAAAAANVGGLSSAARTAGAIQGAAAAGQAAGAIGTLASGPSVLRGQGALAATNAAGTAASLAGATAAGATGAAAAGLAAQASSANTMGALRAMSQMNGLGSNLNNVNAGIASISNNINNVNGLSTLQSINGMNAINNLNGVNGMGSLNSGINNLNAVNGINNAIAGGMSGVSALNNLNGVNGISNLNTVSGLNNLNAANGINTANAINNANAINAVSGANNMAGQYRNLQRREALASGTSGLSNSIAAESELMSGGGAHDIAAAATLGRASSAGVAAAAGAASAAGNLEAAHLANSLAAGSALGAGYGAYDRGLNAYQALAGRGLNEASAMVGAAAAAGAMGALGTDGQMYGGYGASPYYDGVAGAGAAALAGHELNAAQAYGPYGPAGIINQVVAPAVDALVPGVAHQTGLALNRAIARDAAESTTRSLAASQQLEAAAVPLASAANSGPLARVSGAIAAETALTEPAYDNPLTPARQTLAADAHANAEAEAAIAGSDMVAHGLENSQSASLASNAYRQAKLASARDRVNIAGTIQNSARISDAAIATHDAATKAEDSLLGSELAVDSAATVLDSDAAYIPPVTNSMLRSLPYGRLGLRNIVPRPLTYPSVLLPDVWLNGLPVNYKNLPFRMMPYSVGAEGLAAAQMGSVYGINRAGGAPATGALAAGAGLAGMAGSAAGLEGAMNSGLFLEGQPIISNNGIYMNSLLVDPKYAYLRNTNNVEGSSIMPILANGQLEAQDEVAMANILTAQQQLGPGMLGTYGGYARMNTVPMLTGSVSDANLAPTTTVGTTYPIGSALVVEPRDSYFQDYVDNASSRQNFDERQQ